MAEERSANLSSYASNDAYGNNNKITPEISTGNSPRTRTISSVEAREPSQREVHGLTRPTRHRRSSSNRSSRRHRSWRAMIPGSTYRPNYDAPPERPEPPVYLREYRDNRYPEPSESYIRDSERPSRDSYSEYRVLQTNYDIPYQYGYSHEERIWGRGPPEHQIYYARPREFQTCRRADYPRGFSPRPSHQYLVPAIVPPHERYDHAYYESRPYLHPSSDRFREYGIEHDHDYYMDRQNLHSRRQINDGYPYDRHYRTPPRQDYLLDVTRPLTRTSEQYSRSHNEHHPTQVGSSYERDSGYQHSNSGVGAPRAYYERLTEDRIASRAEIRSPTRNS